MRAEAGIESLGLGGGTNNQRSELGGLAEGENEVAQQNKANVCQWIWRMVFKKERQMADRAQDTAATSN